MFRFGTVVICAAMLAGCASVTRGWNEQVLFNSSPPGATVNLSNGLVCMAPCALQIQRKESLTATFTAPGYMPETVEVRGEVAGTGAAGLVGNAVLGGVIGAGVDLASGATLDHCPNPVIVHMRKIGSHEPPSRGSAKCQWELDREAGPPPQLAEFGQPR